VSIEPTQAPVPPADQVPGVAAALRRLQELLEEAGAAHHRAFAATNGVDDAWAQWYAQFLRGRLSPPLKLEPSTSQLAQSLVLYDLDHRRLRRAGQWPEYYALRLVEEYGVRVRQ
jgi:hypothetical protein